MGVRLELDIEGSIKELLNKGLLDKKDLNNPIVRAMIWRAFLEGERLGERRKSV